MTMTSQPMDTRSGKIYRLLNTSLPFNDSDLPYAIGNMTETTGDPLISLQVPAIMFASGVLGNILAICVLLRSSKEHKQTVFYRLVGALACTDLFGTCAISPVTLAVYSNNLNWVGGEALCNYESFMFIFAGYSTIFIIGTMAIDRFIALAHPFFYDSHITYSRAKYIILALWAFAAFMGLLPVMGLGENVKQFPGTWCFFSFTSSEVKNQIFSYMYGTIGLLIIFVTAVSNVVVTFTLLKMRRKAMKSINSCNAKRHDSELQMVILLLGIIITFSTCWCPFLIRILVNQAHQSQIDVKADLHALRLASFNQILDPWIYILFRKELFIRTFDCIRKLISAKCKCLCKEASAEEYGLSAVRSDLKPKSGEIPFVKYENDNAVLVPISGLDDQQPTVGVKDNVGETGSCLTCAENYGNHHKAVTRQPSKNSKMSANDEEMRPLNDIQGPKLILKHSACLFCLSNHPKCVILSSKSMDGLHLLNDGTCCIESNTCSNSDNQHSHSINNVRRESFHQSLRDLVVRTDESLEVSL